ncbi:unnamed protein product, partial [Brenthis ino]
MLTVNASDFHVDAILPPNYKPRDLYVTNVLINGKEYCTNSTLKSTEQRITPKLSCGQRKVKHNQLITHGLGARAGDWPWHVAISSIYNSTFRYICGGSLISDTFVLTAAHCVTKVGVPVLPEYLGISLGKTNLIGANENPQEREVFKIIVHENFNHRKLDNDIALLKLTTKVIFNDYIQPVCMWSDRVDKTVPIGEITGSVVGWGFDQTDSFSPTLRTAHIPLVSDEICIKRKPIFYGSFLNGYKFCAGLINGTSVCNGDSGGGFVVFIPNEDSGITSSPDGVWFIRGIISLALSRENYKNKKFGQLTSLGNNVYTVTLLEDTYDFEVDVEAPPSYTSSLPIYVTSALINGEEYCANPALGTTRNPFRTNNSKEQSVTPKLSCGQRKVKHNQLITYGLEARAGDWPWHVAISSIYNSTFRYICGGSLISETFVLTAAHCVTKVGVPVLPEYLGISLGKTNLIGANENPQEREVFKIIVHENFNHRKLDNDIALLKLTTKVIFNDYIQPVCMWSDRVDKTVPIGEITGSVVGWGFDQTDSFSPTLRTAHIPLVSDEICIKRKPIFYGSFLNGYKFCAGLINGTSVCNGDSGGGFVVFIPNEDSEITSSPDGVWFIRGIISLALSRENYKVSVCDPNEYAIFTDVDKYDDWIKEHMK